MRNKFRKWQDRQCNGQRKKDKRTNNDLQSNAQKTKDSATKTDLTPEVNSDIAEE